MAVLENAVAFRQGLEAALTYAGCVVEHPTDPARWARLGPNRVVVATLSDSATCALIDGIGAHNGTAVALLPDSSPHEYGHAMEHGAMSAIDWNADPDEITQVVVAAAKRMTLLPSSIVKGMAARGSKHHVPPVSEIELGWLLALSNGTTVVDLANMAGYSERSMFRKLHDLYERLGVQNRASAVREAERLGLLGVS